MLLKSYTSEGLVLNRRNFSESDRILTVLTPNKGKISLIAKGVRKLSSRKRGHLEIFSRIVFHAVSGNGLDIVTEVQLVDSYQSLRKDLKKVSLAYYFCEVVDKISAEEDGISDAFTIVSKYLKKLDTKIEYKNIKDLRKEFLKELLVDSGYTVNEENKDIDVLLEEVLERRINSARVGKAVLR